VARGPWTADFPFIRCCCYAGPTQALLTPTPTPTPERTAASRFFSAPLAPGAKVLAASRGGPFALTPWAIAYELNAFSSSRSDAPRFPPLLLLLPLSYLESRSSSVTTISILQSGSPLMKLPPSEPTSPGPPTSLTYWYTSMCTCRWRQTQKGENG
jgi:hypothetical protein